jgi:small-conductance mechanosensitive channel
MKGYWLYILPMIVVLGVIHVVIDYRTVKKGGEYTNKIIRNSLLSGIFLGIYSAVVMYLELRTTLTQSLFVIVISSLFGYSLTASIYRLRKTLGRK